MERAWLTRPLAAQGLSAAFTERAKCMGMETLEDILSTPPQELLAKADFRYEWLHELIGFLQERELLHLLQAIPGRSAG